MFFFVYNSSSFVSQDAISEKPNKKIFSLEVGEELVYNVSYFFISIGQIRIKVLEKNTDDEIVKYKSIAYMDSHRGIPFVDLHEIYESTFNEDIFSYKFYAKSKTRKNIKYVRYDFDYLNHKTYFEHGILNGVKVIEKYDTLNITNFCQDGLSLFYFARKNLDRNESVNIPTIVNEELYNTTINFNNNRTSVEIGSVKYPIDVIKFNGKADFEGVYGFTGAFEGWFSNDEARIPILAKMKVLIGKVRIELMSWKKNNWVPPRAKLDKTK